MTELADGQYELDGLVLGEGTPYRVLKHEDGGVPERRTEDTANSYEDGVTFGRDYLGNTLHTFELSVQTAAGAESWDAVADLLRVWRGDAVRRTPGAVQVLRLKRPGRDTVRAYGRSDKATPTRSRGTGVGLVPVVADFRAVDALYHGDLEQQTIVGIVAGEGGGFAFPMTFPAVSAGETTTSSSVTNAGDADAWPIVTFAAGSGELTRPSFELLDSEGGTLWRIELGITLGAGESVTVDTRPWVRTVLRNDGASLPGARTRACTPPAECGIPPGTWAVRFTGTSSSGTATATVRHRDAYAAG